MCDHPTPARRLARRFAPWPHAATAVRLAGLLLASTVLAACGGDSGTTNPPVSPIAVSVSASAGTVDAGGSTTFTATVSNATNSGVTWGASGGTISGSGASVPWTAPGTGGSYTITATSVEDGSKRANATVTVRSVAVSVAPATRTVSAGDTIAVSATVTNAVDDGVTWTASAGTIIGSGASVQWVAPATEGDYTLTATSTLDPSRSAQATISVMPIVVAVTSADSALFRGATTMVSAVVTGARDTSVTWSTSCGTITGGGSTVEFLAPEAAGSCSVSATSVQDSGAVGTITVTVRRPWLVTALGDANDGSCTSAHCSLREALVEANALPDADTILLFPSAAATRSPALSIAAGTLGTITLASALPRIVTPIEIIGPGATSLTVHANASPTAERGVLEFAGNFTASVVGLALRGGMRPGGAGVTIEDNARVTLRDVHVRDNVSVNANGGGVLALGGGRGTLVDVQVTGNRTTGEFGSGAGFAVEAGSMITMTGGLLSDNETAFGGGGGAFVSNGAVMLNSVTVSNNRAPFNDGPGVGGALHSTGENAVVQLVDVVVDGNSTGSGAGGLSINAGTTATLSGGIVRNNTSVVGGGIELRDATLTLMGTEVVGNTASLRGGGVQVRGASVLTHTGGRIAQNAGGTFGGGGLYLLQNANVTLTDVDVTDNTVSGRGSGIRASFGSKLSMTRGSLTRNSGAVLGGGLYVNDVPLFTLTNVVVEDNSAEEGGGVFVAAGDSRTGGIITGGRFARNVATVGGGGAIQAERSEITVDGTEFRENGAVQGGGAFLGRLGGTYALVNVVAEDNLAAIGGAFGFTGNMSVTITGGILRGNSAEAYGGALWKELDVSLEMVGTQVLSNTAGTQAGGLQLVGPGAPATLTDVTVRGNVATGSSGGGMMSAVPTTVVGSVFADNSAAGTGGGIAVSPLGDLTLRNSTFSNNLASRGGGVGVTGPATLTNVTLVANRAADAGGGIATNGTGAMTVQNVLLAGNLADGVPQDCDAAGSSTITSAGGNLSSDATCVAFTLGTDKPNTAPGVNTTLADNGGSTFTHALLEGSAAINAAVPAGCPATDQRGFTRVGVCDIGAFEFGGQPPSGVRRR